MFTPYTIEILSNHIALAHHIKGRVRFKIDPKIQKYSDQLDLETIATLDKRICGIKTVSLNKLAKSLTIEYDPALIPMSFWDDITSQNNYETISKTLNNLIGGVNMSECELKIEARRMIKNSGYKDGKIQCSLVRALKMRHPDLDTKLATTVAISIIKEASLCVE